MDVELRQHIAGCVWPVIGGVSMIASALLASVPGVLVVAFLGEAPSPTPEIAFGLFAALWLAAVFGGSFIAARGVARSFLVGKTDRERRTTSLIVSFLITGVVTVALVLWTRQRFR